MSFNKITLVGNLGRDPELKHTPQGTPVCTFFIATNERRKDARGGEQKDVTTWFRVTLWGRQAETAAQYLQKGSRVYIEGRLQTHAWDDQQTGQKRYMTEVIANDMIMLDARRERMADCMGGCCTGGSLAW